MLSCTTCPTFVAMFLRGLPSCLDAETSLREACTLFPDPGLHTMHLLLCQETDLTVNERSSCGQG